MTKSTETNKHLHPSERCLLYLLGELSTEDQLRFEIELAKSPELAEMLIDQADGIQMAGSANSHSQLADTHRGSSFRWMAAMLAIAACGLAIVLTDNQSSQFQQTRDEPTEELLIANAWVDTMDHDSSPDALLDDSDTNDVFASNETVGVNEMSDETDNETLAWMLVAFTSESDLQTTTGDQQAIVKESNDES